jgi:GDPmannose 4,6-dehydratase
MPRVLITGVRGQDGVLLSRLLAASGWEVHGTARRSESGPSDADITVHEADLTDAPSFVGVIESVQPDLLVNLAGISSVAQSWDQPVLTSEVSGRVVADLLEACRSLEERRGREVRFVQASSSEIFGSSTVVPQDEDTPIRPTNPYGAAKAFAHLLVGVARMRGQFASTAILYNHESPERPLDFVTRKITRGVAEIATGRAETITLGNLDARRDWSWAGDVVEAIVAIASAPTADDFVVASGISHSVRDFVAAAFAAAGVDDWKGRVLQDERFMRVGDTPEMRGDANKITAELGWHPRVSFEEMVRRMVESDLAQLRSEMAEN